MLQYFHLFLDIALLRRKPQDVPASRTLLGLSVAAAVVSYVLAISSQYTVFGALLRAVLDVAFLAGFLYLLLLWSRYPKRFTQAFTALCGTGTLLQLISWPLVGLADPAGMAGPSTRGLAALLLLGTTIWGVFVIAHILRHTLERSLSLGAALAVLYAIAASLLAVTLFPPE